MKHTRPDIEYLLDGIDRVNGYFMPSSDIKELTSYIQELERHILFADECLELDSYVYFKRGEYKSWENLLSQIPRKEPNE